MPSKINVPQLPESVSDAVVAIWIKKIGDKVEEGDILLELETDKIVLDVPALVSGILTEIFHQRDAVVLAGDVLGLIQTESEIEEQKIEAEKQQSITQGDAGENTSDQSSADAVSEEEAKDNSPGEIRHEILQELEILQDNVPDTLLETTDAIETKESADEVKKDDDVAIEKKSKTGEEGDGEETPVISLFSSPSVRKTMAENEIQAAEIKGSGKKGKILKQDIEQHLQQASDNTKEQQPEKEQVMQESEAPQSQQQNDRTNNQLVDGNQTNTNDSVEEQATEVEQNIEEKVSNNALERRVPMTRLRAKIAERLVEAQQTAAILTTFNDVDLSEIIRLRKIYRERFERAHGIKLGFMSFFVKAATEALKRYPEVNARIDGQDILYQGKYDIGVAVSTERGLVVPIVRDTNTLGHAEIEKKIHDYAHRARQNQLEMEELTGGTFSISNGGVFGSMLSTPIINPPQSAILGMHKIEDRPVAINGEVVIRPMMYLALSYDHRLIDGKTAVSFLVKIKELLEDPASLFLEL